MEQHDDDTAKTPLLEGTVARLVLFGVVVVLAFGAGFGLAAILTGDDDDPPTSPAPTVAEDGQVGHDSHDDGDRS